MIRYTILLISNKLRRSSKSATQSSRGRRKELLSRSVPVDTDTVLGFVPSSIKIAERLRLRQERTNSRANKIISKVNDENVSENEKDDDNYESNQNNYSLPNSDDIFGYVGSVAPLATDISDHIDVNSSDYYAGSSSSSSSIRNTSQSTDCLADAFNDLLEGRSSNIKPSQSNNNSFNNQSILNNNDSMQSNQNDCIQKLKNSKQSGNIVPDNQRDNRGKVVESVRCNHITVTLAGEEEQNNQLMIGQDDIVSKLSHDGRYQSNESIMSTTIVNDNVNSTYNTTQNARTTSSPYKRKAPISKRRHHSNELAASSATIQNNINVTNNIVQKVTTTSRPPSKRKAPISNIEKGNKKTRKLPNTSSSNPSNILDALSYLEQATSELLGI